MKILLTGYEPFLDFKVNPTEEIVKVLNRTNVGGVDIIGEILSLNYLEIGSQIRELIALHAPDAIILMGQASRPAISIEKVALNYVNSAAPYNCGTIVKDTPIDSNGPVAYFSTLPVTALVALLREHNIPTTLSLSAGAYGCNQVFYETMHYLSQTDLPIPAGFVHIPLLPEQAITGKVATMDYSIMKKAIKLIITYLADQM